MHIARRVGKAVEVVRLSPHACRVQRGFAFRKRLIRSDVEWSGFWLFTFAEDEMEGLDLNARHRKAMNAWRLFRARMWEKGLPFRFALTVEWTEKDVPHFHVLIDRYLPKRKANKAWIGVGGGKFMRAAKVRGGASGQKQAINYICKYITKFRKHVSGCRRWAYSQKMLAIVKRKVSEWVRVTVSDILTMNLENELHVDNGNGVWLYFETGWVERSP